MLPNWLMSITVLYARVFYMTCNLMKYYHKCIGEPTGQQYKIRFLSLQNIVMYTFHDTNKDNNCIIAKHIFVIIYKSLWCF